LTGDDQTTVTTVQAVAALRARGVNTAEGLLEYATPDQILIACHRWDGQQGVGPGLLARWIRDGQFLEPEPAEPPGPGLQLRTRFDQYAARYPVGTVIEPHQTMIDRRWRNDPPCDGRIVVVDTTWPALILECDKCGFNATIPPRQLSLLDRIAQGHAASAEPIF
jgi:hypothetical protein